MNDAVDVPLVLGSHWDNVTTLALRHKRFLEVGLHFGIVHQSIQCTQQSILGNAQFAAYAGHGATGVVLNLATFVDATGYFGDDVLTWLDI